ncbi:hypothetical protein FC756_08785 [Lysinibacillus mangiferihumi]|uniref:Uncharacterized protein n=1 Tax=Lysinibacillus mangiferihumi TaxID=1130819 RepID=A0A4U2Z8E6_9BACI|nr:hypothetical protein [Lysinibacillus mangiferihumi]TKI69760.1 hypothetical protein FC756_08785 [Lysinibacillus mangiferihumi]
MGGNTREAEVNPTIEVRYPRDRGKYPRNRGKYPRSRSKSHGTRAIPCAQQKEFDNRNEWYYF